MRERECQKGETLSLPLSRVAIIVSAADDDSTRNHQLEDRSIASCHFRYSVRPIWSSGFPAVLILTLRVYLWKLEISEQTRILKIFYFNRISRKMKLEFYFSAKFYVELYGWSTIDKRWSHRDLSNSSFTLPNKVWCISVKFARAPTPESIKLVTPPPEIRARARANADEAFPSAGYQQNDERRGRGWRRISLFYPWAS